MRARTHLVAMLIVLAAPARGWASSAEVFGLGSEAAALGGAMTARSTGWEAGYYNPAGLCFGGGKEATLGFLAFGSALSINDKPYALSEKFGVELGARLPVPLGGALKERFHLGFAMYMLPTTILRVIARLPDEAFYPYYDDRTQRLLILPSLGIKLHRRVSIGVGFNFLAGLGGAVESNQGPDRALDARVDEQIFTNVKLNVGARVELGYGLSLGAVFRQAFSVPFKTTTHNVVAGQNIDLNVDAEGLFTPNQVYGGVAWKHDRVGLSFDMGWLNWAGYKSPYVAVSSELPLAGALDVAVPKVKFENVLSYRAGVEVAVVDKDDLRLETRLGFGYEGSAVPAQHGVTNLVDGNKINLGGGLGLRLAKVLPRPMRIDVHLQAQIVGDRKDTKVLAGKGEMPDAADKLVDEVKDLRGDLSTSGFQTSNPGYPVLKGGGMVYGGGLTMTFEM